MIRNFPVPAVPVRHARLTVRRYMHVHVPVCMYVCMVKVMTCGLWVWLFFSVSLLLPVCGGTHMYGPVCMYRYVCMYVCMYVVAFVYSRHTSNSMC